MGKSKCMNIVILRGICSKPIKLIHIQNLLPDFCLSLPILDLISDTMPSWRQFLPYVWRLRRSLQCQLLLKLYGPSSPYINTHTHTPYSLTCARALQCNTHYAPIWLLSRGWKDAARTFLPYSNLYICSANANAHSWLESFQHFELWNRLTVLFQSSVLSACMPHWGGVQV